MNQWNVEASWGTASAMHDRPIPEDPGRLVWLHQIPRPALVLGSAQKEEQLDLARARADGLEVCRRRSGGGAVLIDVADCWIDVVIPRGDRLWNDDVGHAFHWIGDLWGAVLEEVGISPNVVHRGPPIDRDFGRLVCFAGVGAGEVVSRGTKVVGLSQRRTRNAARFQCLVPFGPDLAPIQRYLASNLLVHGVPVDVSSVPVGALTPSTTLIDRFLSHLASL